MVERRASESSVTVGTTASGVTYRIATGGYPDLLFVQDGLLPVAALTQFPPYRQFLHHLGSFGRLICFDRRGIGSSSRAGRYRPFGLADWADDAYDVLVAAGVGRAIIVALAEGAMTAIALAARHPERVAGLALINATPGPSLGSLARRGQGPRYIDYLRSTLPQGWSPEVPGLEVVAPSLGRDQRFSAWLTDAFRRNGDARQFLPTFDVALRSHVQGHLSQVRAPTLVVHRRDDGWFSTDHGLLVARAIEGARYLELPGADHAPYVGATSDLLGAIGSFITELLLSRPGRPPRGRQVAEARLSPRQVQILQMVRTGLTDKEVAARLQLSPRTVQKHLELAYRRLGVTNRTAAAAATGLGGHMIT